MNWDVSLRNWDVSLVSSLQVSTCHATETVPMTTETVPEGVETVPSQTETVQVFEFKGFEPSETVPFWVETSHLGQNLRKLKYFEILIFSTGDTF